MKAKFVYEAIGDILKPKNREEIIKNLQNLDPIKFYERYDYLTNFFGGKIPFKYHPLIGQIYHDMRKRYGDQITYLKEEDLGSMGKSIEFSAIIKERHIWVNQSEHQIDIMFKIWPFKRIKKLKHIRLANNYMIENIEQYNELIKYL